MALCTRESSTEQTLEAMTWYFGEYHCRSVQFIDDTAGDQAGKSFDLNVINESYVEVKYLAWLDNGVAAAPTPAADQTLLPISLTNGDTAETQATAFETALASLPVKVEVTGDVVEVRNNFVGAITVEVNTNATGLTFAVGKLGFGGRLGQIAQGGATLTIDETVLEIKADETGETVLDELQTGIVATIAMTLAEMTSARWESLVANVSGGIVTITSNDIVGYGTDKLYKSKLNYAGYLVGHPVRLPFSDRSADLSMFTAPKMSTINFSGTDIQGAEFEFKAYRDTKVDAKINLVRRGDHSLL